MKHTESELKLRDAMIEAGKAALDVSTRACCRVNSDEYLHCHYAQECANAAAKYATAWLDAAQRGDVSASITYAGEYDSQIEAYYAEMGDHA